MAHLLKQQPLQNSPVQQVSIIAQCSGVMFHLHGAGVYASAIPGPKLLLKFG